MLFHLTVFNKNQRRQFVSSGLLSSWDQENRKNGMLTLTNLVLLKIYIFFSAKLVSVLFWRNVAFLYDDILFFFFVPANGYCTRHVLFTKEIIFGPHFQLSLPFVSVFIVDVCTSCIHPPITFFTAVQPMIICLNILRTFIANFADSTILSFAIGMETAWTFLPLFWCCNNCTAERCILRHVWCLIFYC